MLIEEENKEQDASRAAGVAAAAPQEETPTTSNASSSSVPPVIAARASSPKVTREILKYVRSRDHAVQQENERSEKKKRVEGSTTEVAMESENGPKQDDKDG